MHKFLFITNSLGFGGAEKMLTFVASSLADRGHDVCIANLNRVPDYVNTKRQSISKKISVFERQHSCELSKIEDLKFLLRISRREKPSVIIGFTEYPSIYAKVIGTLLGIPSVMSERADPSRSIDLSKLKQRIAFSIVNASKGGVFQTEGARAFYGKGLQRRGTVIPNPIFIKGEIPKVSYDERGKTVVSVGRLDNTQKRYDVMLDAFKIFSVEHPEYTLRLYGKGDDEEMIRRWTEERGLAEKVSFMGLSTQPMQDICRDGMFLITSDFEGISNSLLEAMAVGLPCVSTDHTPGGARLLIDDHKNGLLAPVGDAASLAAAMCEFAEDPALAEECGNNAKDVVNRFAPERIIDMWEDYILNLCK